MNVVMVREGPTRSLSFAAGGKARLPGNMCFSESEIIVQVMTEKHNKFVNGLTLKIEENRRESSQIVRSNKA